MILVAGCGALGSQIALQIAHLGERFVLIDDDRVEDHNVTTGTSAYSLHHAGALKVVVLAELLWRKCGAEAETDTRTLTMDRMNHQVETLSPDEDLILDTFDNVQSRQFTRYRVVPTLHVGVSENRVGAVQWDEDYALPDSPYRRGENPVCTHHLGAPSLRLQKRR